MNLSSLSSNCQLLHNWCKLLSSPDRPEQVALAAIGKMGLGSLLISISAGNMAAIDFKTT